MVGGQFINCAGVAFYFEPRRQQEDSRYRYFKAFMYSINRMKFFIYVSSIM